MARKFNYERAAAALVDAAYLGDAAAAKKWDVSVRTIEIWRERLKTDLILSEFFARKRRAAESQWSTRLKRLLGAVMDKSQVIVESINPIETYEDEETGLQEQRVNLDALPILIRAGKDLGELAIALEVLNAGDPDQDADPPAQGPGLAQGKPLPN